MTDASAPSSPAPSWFDGVTDAVAACASSALAVGEAAGAGLYDQLAGALARVQALPEEAAGAVAELTAAVGALLPGESLPHRPPVPALAAPACDAAAGQAAPVPGAIVPAPQAALPRRTQIDPAGLTRFLRARHPERTAESAAAVTRLPVETVAKILARQSLGNGRTLMAFVIGYGPDLLAAVVPNAEARWLEGARILADQARLEAEAARIRAEAEANGGRWTLCGYSFGGTP